MQLALVEARDVFAAEEDAALLDVRGRFAETGEGEAEGRLARPRLADEPDELAAGEPELDVAHGVRRIRPVSVVDRQVVYF
jgi:hypothetical protein